MRNISTGFLKGLRAKCDHKVPKRGLSTDRSAGINFGKNYVILSILHETPFLVFELRGAYLDVEEV